MPIEGLLQLFVDIPLSYHSTEIERAPVIDDNGGNKHGSSRSQSRWDLILNIPIRELRRITNIG